MNLKRFRNKKKSKYHQSVKMAGGIFVLIFKEVI